MILSLTTLKTLKTMSREGENKKEWCVCYLLGDFMFATKLPLLV